MDAVIAKIIHFNCPACEEPVEAPEFVSGGLISCPRCGREFRPPGPASKVSSSWLVVLCLGGVLAGLMIGIPAARWQAQRLVRARGIEAPSQQQMRFQTEAQNLLLRQCTNTIVGLNRFINLDLQTRDNDPNRWTARVTAEFVNRVGGVERTEVPFVFWTFKSPADGREHLLCRVDQAKVSQAETEASNRRLENARRLAEPEETAKN